MLRRKRVGEDEEGGSGRAMFPSGVIYLLVERFYVFNFCFLTVHTHLGNFIYFGRSDLLR